MSAQPSLQLTLSLEKRISKRQEIESFFAENIGKKFRTDYLHFMFGTAFRSRVSEINKSSKSLISVLNETKFEDGQERSIYYSVKRG